MKITIDNQTSDSDTDALDLVNRIAHVFLKDEPHFNQTKSKVKFPDGLAIIIDILPLIEQVVFTVIESGDDCDNVENNEQNECEKWQ